jgi:hypothetical protein
MYNTTYQLDNFALTLPITQNALTTAQTFANQQPTLEKAEQVRLNTLAVWVVNDYLQMMDIPTNLQGSDSWNQVLRFCNNVADLELPAIGRLECRPVNLDQQRCHIPPETWEERVGYVVVKIDELHQEAQLLGFVPRVTTEEIPLSQLQSPEVFIDHLAELKQSSVIPQVNLSQWFAGIFETGWQTVESLLSTPELRPAYAFRSVETLEPEATKRAKLIDLGIAENNQPFMLIVEVSSGSDNLTNIYLKLLPTGDQVHLPAGLEIAILNQSSSVIVAAQARQKDNYIQLQLKGEPTEQFSVQVKLNNASFIENFLI